MFQKRATAMGKTLMVLDAAKVGGGHRRVIFGAGLGIFLDGFDLSIIAVALILLVPEWQLSSLQTGLIGSATLAGAALGGVVGGRVADVFGRKLLYLIDIVTFLVAAILCGLSWNVMSLVIFRFLLGIGVGMDYPISASYIAEFMPRADRGIWLSWAFTLWTLGAIASAVVGLLLVGTGVGAWRWMFLSGAVPATIVIWLRRNLPESPRWYLSRGMDEEAEAVVATVSGSYTVSQVYKPTHSNGEAGVPLVKVLTMLAQRQMLSRLILVVCPWMLSDISVYGLAVYLPMLLGDFGIHSHVSQVAWNIGIDIVGLYGVIALALSTRRIGRIVPQKIGFMLMTIFLGALGVSSVYGNPSLFVLVSSVFGYVFFSNFGPATTTWFLLVELFATNVRAFVHGIATALSRVAAALTVFVLPSLHAAIGNAWLMIVLSATTIAGFLITALLGRGCEPGTRSLEDVSVLLDTGKVITEGLERAS